MRTAPVNQGDSPYSWNVPSVYQCTWYCYFRALECGLSAPTYYDKATKVGSYPNAKDWLANVREPWVAKGPEWTPEKYDILVYDGEYGHVIFCESESITSEYRSGDKDSFRNAKVGEFKGDLLGVLHYPLESVLPVTRNENAPQIKTTDETLRIRTAPTLKAEIVGHVKLGYYNVLDEENADGYTWYEISKDRWCADITTEYLPSNSNDLIRQIEKWANEMTNSIKLKDEKISELESGMKQINEIARKWV